MSFNHGILKDITLSSGIVVGYAHLSYYMNDFKDDIMVARLEMYVDKASALAGKTPIDVDITDNITTQFSYPEQSIDSSKGHELGLLNHIVANEEVFKDGVIE